MRNKTAIINTAQKYAAKGMIDKAIAEWQKLLDNGKDGNIHNTIGDLFLRKGSDKEAVSSFSKAAEIFRKDGFYPKAIAIYKKVLNIEPNDVDALIAMAKLNANRGLIGNAADNYYRAAEILNKDGSAEKATQIVDKILQLSPSDINLRSRIAHLYFRIGQREKAANEYSAIASTYLDDSALEKASEFYRKALDCQAENIPAHIGLSKVASKEGNSDEAFEYLNKAMSRDKKNKEVLLAYASIAIERNRTDDAKRVLTQLIESNPSAVEPKKLLADIYLKEENAEKAWDELLPCIDNALDAEKWTEAQELLHVFEELQTIPVRERFLRICKSQGDKNALQDELTNVARLYEHEGSIDEALKLCKEAHALNSEDSVVTKKIRELEAQLGVAPSMDDEPSREIEIQIDDNFPAEEISQADTASPAEAAPQKDEGSPRDEPPLPEESSHAHEIPTLEFTSFEEQLSTSSEPEQADMSPQDPVIIPNDNQSEDDLVTLKAEADFFAQQGLTDEAIKIYEELHAAYPDNDEIAHKLQSLKSTAGQGNEVSIESVEQVQEDKIASNTLIYDEAQTIAGDEAVDYESHYAAGLDFKQKGLMDEAISELQIAARDPEKKLRNATMLAMCYKEKGSLPLAIAEFNKIIHSMSPADSTFLYVKYELANAHMANKEYLRALELFSEVREQNPDFKDVSSKVDSLMAQTQQEKNKTKKDRVSYI